MTEQLSLDLGPLPTRHRRPPRDPDPPWWACPDCRQDYTACTCPLPDTPTWADGWEHPWALNLVWTRTRIRRPIHTIGTSGIT